MAFSWSLNQNSCVAVWGCLRSLDQFNQTFVPAGTLTINQMAFWNANASPAMQQILANAMAAQLDKMFQYILGAGYASQPAAGAPAAGAPAAGAPVPVTGATAIAAMATVLATSTKTLTDLASVVDGLYVFNSNAN